MCFLSFGLMFDMMVSCMAQWFLSINFKFRWLFHRSVGSNPGQDTCIVEQDALTTIASLHTKGVYSAKVDTVY